MPRTVHTFLPLPGDPGEAIEAFLGDPSRWLPEARHTGPDRWEMPVGPGGIERVVEVTVGAPWRVGTTWWRTLTWRPLAGDHDPVAVERLLPSLDAELGVVQDASERLTLALDGRYSAPGGRLGEALDAVAMHGIAKHTLERLVAAIGQELSVPVSTQPPPV
jgi:hypothetical protein